MIWNESIPILSTFLNILATHLQFLQKFHFGFFFLETIFYFLDHLQSTLSLESEQSLECDGIKSPLREISPKFVVGSKKYGRRSRPQYASDIAEDVPSSDSDNEQIVNSTNSSLKSESKSPKVQRSASQSDLHGTRRRPPVGSSKLKRCASLPAQKNPRQIEKNNQLGKVKASIETSVLGVQKLDSSIDSLGKRI